VSAPARYQGRLSRLRSSLGRRGPAAVLITHLPNVRWLCGFSGSAGSLLVSSRDAVFFSDFRYRTQVHREVRVARFVEHTGGNVEAIAAAVSHARVARLGFEAERMTVASHGDLAAALHGVELVPLRGVVEGLRAIKDAWEVARVRQALTIADRALASSTHRLAGATENAVAARLQTAIRREGGDEESFPTIVASGPRSALPHGLPTDRLIGGGDLVVIDYGVRYKGYCCDLTRTYSPLKWDRRSKRIYQVVLEAQRAALAAIKPGAKASDVDAAARGVIDRAGYGKFFGHGTGHGVGLEVHERPTISPRSGDILKPGMIFTVEPGIYIEHFGGVRIEDMVLVKDKGMEILSHRVKKLLDR
jgi:Xaa-Pro aminopeptidase